MTPVSTPTEPLILCGDLELGVWGVAVGEAPPRWMFASFDHGPLATIEPLSVRETDATSRTEDADQLLQMLWVEALIDRNGEQQRVELPGFRISAISSEKLDSLRVLGVWVSAGHQLALSARRPKSAHGQDRDDVQALVAADECELVVDPRLSTTYDQHDSPRRVGVELWLQHEDDDAQHSVRFAGEVAGDSLAARTGSLTLAAHGLRCWDNDEAGAGVYVLLKPSNR